MSKKKNKKQQKGKQSGSGLGKLGLLALVLVCCAGTALWLLAPDQVQAQLDRLKGLLGG